MLDALAILLLSDSHALRLFSLCAAALALRAAVPSAAATPDRFRRPVVNPSRRFLPCHRLAVAVGPPRRRQMLFCSHLGPSR